MSYKIERGNVAKKSLRFHALVKMLSDYQPVINMTVAASRQIAPEVIIVMLMSPRGRVPIACFGGNHGDVYVAL